MKSAVIGAGITGLTCAHSLHKQGNEVLILESSGNVGGVVGSNRIDGYLVESGPNSLSLDATDIRNFFQELGLGEETIPANQQSRHRFIVRDGNLVPLPLSPLSLVTTRAFSLAAKFRLLREFFIPPIENTENLSVASFFRQRLGREFFSFAGDPFISGVYAGDPEKLSVKHAFPRMLEMEQAHGSLIKGFLKSAKARKNDPTALKRQLVSFKDGMASLINALTQRIRPENIKTEATLTQIEQHGEQWRVLWHGKDGKNEEDTFDQLVITVPAHALKGLPLPDALAKTLEPLAEISHPPMACMALGFRRTQVSHPLDGFGVLVPSCEGKNLLGAIFATTLFPGRAPLDHVLLQCFVGGRAIQPRADSGRRILRNFYCRSFQACSASMGSPPLSMSATGSNQYPSATLDMTDSSR